MKRMHLKIKRKKRKKSNLIIPIIILLIISISYVFKVFNEKALPIFMEYSELETKKIVSLIVTTTITEEVAKNTIMDDLFITSLDNNGNINTIDFNSSNVNLLLTRASKLVDQNLRYLENGEIDKLSISRSTLSNYDSKKLVNGIFYELPSGIIFNNPILSNIFPKIPIKLDLIGNAISILNTDIESYGINSALLKVNIEITVEVKVLLPFTTKKIEVVSNIPIVMKIIEGNIPSYYLGGYLDKSISSN